MAPNSTSAVLTNHQEQFSSTKYNLKNESDRVKTFVDNRWKDNHVSAKKLASTGCYFHSQPDKVKCVFCNVILEEFENGDDVLKEHLKFSPNCPLLRRRKTSNVAINQKELEKFLPPPSYDECGSSMRRKSSSSWPEALAHPQYLKPKARLSSFETHLWPIGLKQKPKELVEAGFFYSGKSDITICFSCGVCLGKWEEGDNPWIEHKKNLVKDCKYLTTNKDLLHYNENNHKELAKKVDIEDHLPEISADLRCKICFVRKSNVAFLPCKHVAVCMHCSLWIDDKCPICRGEIKERISLFYS